MKIVGFSLLALLCLVFVVSFFILKEGQINPRISREAFTAIPVRGEDPSVGPAGAKVTVVYFSSFTCAACRATALTIDQLRAVYGDKIRIIRKDLPLDTETARTASLAARCAQQQGKFWQYHDELFSQQGNLLDDSTIWLSIADALRLDKTLFTQCLNDRSTLSLIEQDIADATTAGIPSIPYFEVNSKVRVAEDIPLSQWRQIIDSALIL